MKIHNFSAGPSILPQPVFQEASNAILDFNQSGLSILEISHRSDGFVAVLEETQALINELFELKNEFDILFLSGGASTQFFMVPMNYLGSEEKAQYLDTGTWSSNAIKEAKAFGKIDVLASSKDKNYTYIPKQYQIDPTAKYLHVTSNNTIFGTQLHAFPETSIPLVCDMSSDVMSRRIDASKFGIIYAGAQKNLGPAGVTIVLIKKDWAKLADREIPTMLKYATHIAKDSCHNTPPTFPIYAMMLNLRWLKALGGIGEIEKRNIAKATLLYKEIDRNPLFEGTVVKEDRSNMNPTFLLKDASKNDAFLSLTGAAGIDGITGHRSVGGFRASMYNAMDISSVQVLVDVMKEFEKSNG